MIRPNVHPELKGFLNWGLRYAGQETNPAIHLARAAHYCCFHIRSKSDFAYLLPTLYPKTRENDSKFCMSFVQAMVAYVEDRFEIESPLPYSDTVLDVWDQAYARIYPAKGPALGDIPIWRLRNSPGGHAGIVFNNSFWPNFMTAEGNTKSGHFKDDKELGELGVSPHSRRQAGSDNLDLLGFLRPF